MKQKIKNIWPIIVVVVLIAGSVLAYGLYRHRDSLGFSSNPDTADQATVQNYKKALFTSALCQYNCPLVDMDVNGTKQLLPEYACMKTCITDSHVREFNQSQFSINDLKTDSLLDEVQAAIMACRKLALSNESINAQVFTSCSSAALAQIKVKYPYLQ